MLMTLPTDPKLKTLPMDAPDSILPHENMLKIAQSPSVERMLPTDKSE